MNESAGLAEEISAKLKQKQVDPLLIGAAALAAHGYLRTTKDIDFAVCISPSELKSLATKLPGKVTADEPTPTDPLGGVVTSTRGKGMVQVVNFDNQPGGGFPKLVKDALTRSTGELFGAKLVSLEDLILFKAYAGGKKSRNDVAELLARTRPDIQLVRERADAYRIRKDVEFVLDLDDE